MAYPQTITLNAGDKLLYTGGCQLQVSIVLSDGNTQPIASVSAGSFAEAPVTTTYELKIVGGTCCVPGGHVVYPAVPADGGSGDTPPPVVTPVKVSYCNLETGTHHIKTCVFTIVDGVVTEEIFGDTDLGVPCGEAIPAHDVEISTVCRDGYKWEIHYRYVTVDGVTTKEVLAEENTGFTCVEEDVHVFDYCIASK